MRKTKLFKRTAAITLSAAMVVTGINVAPASVEKASAAEVPTPVFSMDFSGTMDSNGTYTEGGNTFLTKSAKIENGALVLETGGATNSSSNSYLKSDKIFSNNDFSNGITVQLDYTSKQQSGWGFADWDNVFSFGEVAGNSFIGATIGTITKVGATNCFPGGSWNTSTSVLYNNYKGTNKENPYDYFCLSEHENETHTFTYAYSTSGVNFYVDGLLSNSWTVSDPSLIYSSLKDGHFAIGTMPDDKLETCHGTYDNIKIYDKSLTTAEVYKNVTGKDRTNDATELEASIKEAAKYTRSELYTTDTYQVLTDKLAAANSVDGDPMATADQIATAKAELDSAIAGVTRTSTDVDTDILLNADLSSKSYYKATDNKSLYSNGYLVSALGDATISADGYISTPGTNDNTSADDNGTQGVKIDAGMLKNISADKGLTINAVVSIDDFSSISDWSDIISLYSAEDKYITRVTSGLCTILPNGVYCFPHGNYGTNYGAQSTLFNGGAGDSYKTYFSAADKKCAVTITIDKQYISFYFAGILLDKYDYTKYVNAKGEATNDKDGNAGYANALTDIISNISTITVFNTKDETNDRNDIAGKVYGVQVYGRALDASEVDTLANAGVTKAPIGITFKNQAADATISIKDANGTEVATATCGSDGTAAVHGLTSDATYTWTVKNGDTWTREGSITVNSDKVIDGYPLQSVKFAKDTVTVENSKIDNEFKAGISSVPDLELAPATTTETKDLCKITYVSDNENVVKVDANDGKLTGVADGSANITATVVSPSGNTFTATCKVNVSTKVITSKATAVKLDKNSETLEVGKTLQLKAEVTPAEALQQGKWTSSNAAVATVNDAGLVTAVASGEAIVTFTTDDGTNLTATCKITVNQKNVAVTGITIDKQTVSIEIGKAATLSACVLPENASNKNVTWKSENEKIATVKDGVVTGVAAGTVKIYAVSATDEKIVATCTVTVTEPKKDDTNKDDTNNDNTNNNNSTNKKPATKKLKSATITVKNGKKKVSSVTVKRKKTVKLSVSVNSKTKLSLTKLSKKSAKIAKVTFKKNKLTIKGLKKGKISIKLTSKKNSKYKAATKTVKVTVK